MVSHSIACVRNTILGFNHNNSNCLLSSSDFFQIQSKSLALVDVIKLCRYVGGGRGEEIDERVRSSPHRTRISFPFGYFIQIHPLLYCLIQFNVQSKFKSLVYKSSSLAFLLYPMRSMGKVL